MSDCRGLGVTRDMSSRGVCIETDHVLKVGKRVRLLIDWPVELDGGIAFAPRGCGQNCAQQSRCRRSERVATRVSAPSQGLIEAQSQGFPGFSSHILKGPMTDPRRFHVCYCLGSSQ